MKTIIIPLDRSPRSETAVDPGTALAKRLGADLRVLTAVRGGDLGEADDYLDQVVLGHGIGHAHVDVVHHDDPAAAIIDAASQAPGATVCMATRGRGGLGEMVLGSVAADVLHRTSEPVLLVGPDASRVDPHATEIVMCWDGSDRSRTVVRTAAEWAKALDVAVRVLHIRWPADPGYGLAVTGELTDGLDAVTSALREEGVEARWQVFDDPEVAETIVSHLTDGTALVVATSHGRGGPRGPSGAALGHVVAKVVRTSPCPVLVQPA